jgi:hypothetical protein
MTTILKHIIANSLIAILESRLMDKRYQVFVSSTYADLKEERNRVIQTLMEMDCIPAGMELFPAMDEEQLEFIKRVIDDCDYYILIIGGRYGSTTSEGISYTEKEYDYAIEKRLKVLAFIHEKPEDIPAGKSENDPEMLSRLTTFRGRVSRGRLVKYWNSAEQLPGLVSLSLNKTIKTYPATGWVRADQVSSAEILSELNELRKQNHDLEQTLAAAESKRSDLVFSDLATLDETMTFSGEGRIWRVRISEFEKFSWTCTPKWSELFALIAPYLMNHPYENSVKEVLKEEIFGYLKREGEATDLKDQDFQTAKIQLLALGLVDVKWDGNTQRWSLNRNGYDLMMQLRTIKSSRESASSVI